MDTLGFWLLAVKNYIKLTAQDRQCLGLLGSPSDPVHISTLAARPFGNLYYSIFKEDL